VPAGGQGALAIEGLADALPGGSAEIQSTVAAMDDVRTHIEVSAERACLAEIGASCASPIGVRARAQDGRLAIRVLLFSLDGGRSMTDSLSVSYSADIAQAERAGVDLARRMLACGVAELIGDGV
jgi:hydroxymethylbilane synthase